MAFEFRITIPENSPEEAFVLQVAAAEHITPEQAGHRLFIEALKAHLTPNQTPAQKLLGAFSSDEDSEAIDRAIQVVRDRRPDHDAIRDLSF